ncbi:putative amidoligase enzyme [Desulfobotulus alkaliphilus]|uniref:Putative amidoligase enzyme n=1 Tax=Desulfobotulus alkaliphilus TaxID=622671 RepID=A0A562S7T1_9BACT|nr:amidoligase family protein [Desulfobotulus alkaliphilus]TWI77487.1 putative amidoligase enzyme [Desulfobotulus alkaliphilus]
MEPLPPPEAFNSEGNLRSVGVEIEFSGLPAPEAADIVQALFYGEKVAFGPHRFEIQNTQWGTFGIELDTQYAHPKDQNLHPENKIQEKKSLQYFHWELEKKAREFIGDMAMAVVPMEIVCPPLPWDQLNLLDSLMAALQRAGAKGTEGSIFYAFGLHLNPELSDFSVHTILSHLRAYILLSKWLRKDIGIDITREILPHTQSFPQDYAFKILDAGYCPDLDALIMDYLEYNPTRNRELDLFPLFAFLRPGFPHEIFSDALIRPRPTFHYRLPNASFINADAAIVKEWNRWLLVEKLASDKERLGRTAKEYLDQGRASVVDHWLENLRMWMKEL